MINFYEIQGLFPNILQEGFSAYKASLGASDDTMVANWSVAYPAFSSEHFNMATGLYTAPITGVYTTQATISYQTNSAITTQLGASINPTFTIRRTSPTSADLLSGQLPIFYTNLVLLSLRTILAACTITLSGVVQLTEGDTLGLYYNADGMSLALTLQELRWAAYRLS